MNNTILKICLECKKEFVTNKITKVYCTNYCGDKFRHHLTSPRIQKCKKCSKEFLTRNQVHLFCSLSCRRHYEYSYKTGNTYPVKSLSTGIKGSIAELKTSADLLSKGYEVFTAASPSCSCDLIASKDGILLRIEVRNGYKKENSEVYCPKYLKDKNKQDHYAIVLENEIIYDPIL